MCDVFGTALAIVRTGSATRLEANAFDLGADMHGQQLVHCNPVHDIPCIDVKIGTGLAREVGIDRRLNSRSSWHTLIVGAE